MKSDSSVIRIYTTGGSIDKTYDLLTSEFLVGPPQIAESLRVAHVNPQFEIVEFFRKDSLEITEDDRKRLHAAIAADSAQRVIVTHGTDTMPLTGQVLSSIKDKVIVLTGSMQPASFRDTDADFNLGTAFIAVQLLPAGTYLVMNGSVFDPRKVKKNFDKRCFEAA